MTTEKMEETTEGLHEGHRGNLRRNFSSRHGKQVEDHRLLEMLMNGYLSRQDTNISARERLVSEKLEGLLKQYERLPLLPSAIESYLSVGGKLSRAIFDANLLIAIPLFHLLHRLDLLCQLFRPLRITCDSRVFFLGFDGGHNLCCICCTAFGDADLPISLQNRLQTNITHLLLVIQCHSLSPIQLMQGILYYWDQLLAAKKDCHLAGVLLLSIDRAIYCPTQTNAKKAVKCEESVQ